MSDTSLQAIPDTYRWSFPGAPIQIHFKIELVAKLRSQIRNVGLMPGEISACGLLKGVTLTPGVTSVLDITPLSTLDAAGIEAAARRAPGDVVGFYRTTTVGVDKMPDEDRALADAFFRDPGSVFMLIETGESDIGPARFCFWGEGQIFDFPVMAFPMDAAELAARESKRRLHRVVAPSSSTSEALEATGSPEQVRELAPKSTAGLKEPSSQRRKPFLQGWLAPVLTTLVLASLLVAAFLYARGLSNPRVVPKAAAPSAAVPAPLGLSVERRGKDLRVSWNSSAEPILKADFGMLLVRGNAVSRDVPLTAEELRAGSVVYASAVDQLRFQLTVVGGGQVSREFLTIVLPQGGANPPSRETVASSPAGHSAASEAPRPAVPGAPVIRREFRQGKNSDPGAATAPGLAEPPPVSSELAVQNVNPALLNHPTVSPNPPVSRPAPVDVPPQPQPQPQRTLQAVAESEAKPPIATSQVVPPVPALLRGRIWKATSVDVNVAVDMAGKVVKAEAAEKPGVHPLLRDAAVQAALRWKFQPAQFDGHPVPANIVLQFNFAANR